MSRDRGEETKMNTGPGTVFNDPNIHPFKRMIMARDTREEILQLQAQLRQEREAREHVAWLRFKKRSGSEESYLVLCDSDAPGAFKVYR